MLEIACLRKSRIESIEPETTRQNYKIRRCNCKSWPSYEDEGACMWENYVIIFFCLFSFSYELNNWLYITGKSPWGSERNSDSLKDLVDHNSNILNLFKWERKKLVFSFFPPCTVYLVVWRERSVEVKEKKERRGMVTPSLHLDVKSNSGKE